MATPWIGAAAQAMRVSSARPAFLRPRAAYGLGGPQAVLVLQTGPNASVDYYLRPRLQADATRPWAIADLHTAPRDVPLLSRPGLWVVICRYVNEAWIEALRQARPTLAGVSFFVDDDLPAMMSEPGSPFEARLKVRTRYQRFVGDLEGIVSEAWVSTPALAARFDAPVRLIPPVPFDDPKPPRRNEPPLVVYHGTLTHDAERAFVREVAKRLEGAPSAFRLEVAGGLSARLAWAGRRQAVVRSQQAWPDYVREQQSRSAAILLAPLTDGDVNDARAPVKVFDAARLAAAGLFADRPPYADAVSDGVDGRLLLMDPQAWADATLGLLGDPDARFALAAAAYEKARALRACIGGLFDGPPR